MMVDSTVERDPKRESRLGRSEHWQFGTTPILSESSRTPCFGGPRVVSRSIPTEPNRVVGTCIRGAKPITDDVLFQTTFLFAADVLTLPVKDLDRAARGTLGRSVSARSTDASLLTRSSSSSAMEVVAFDALGIEGQHRRLRVNPRATRDSRCSLPLPGRARVVA